MERLDGLHFVIVTRLLKMCEFECKRVCRSGWVSGSRTILAQQHTSSSTPAQPVSEGPAIGMGQEYWDARCSVFVTAARTRTRAAFPVLTRSGGNGQFDCGSGEAILPTLGKVCRGNARKETRRGHARSQLCFKSNISSPSRHQDASRKDIDC